MRRCLPLPVRSVPCRGQVVEFGDFLAAENSLAGRAFRPTIQAADACDWAVNSLEQTLGDLAVDFWV